MATATMATTTATETITLDARRQEKSLEPVFPDVNTIRKAIPPHCFKPSALRSLSYVARDLLLAGGLVWAALTFIPQLPSPYLRFAAWSCYGFAQGLVGTGLWILAHECGHGAFSLHRRLNDVVGWVLHSLLLVPYFSWKFSHARHHMFTGHMQKDMAFVPATKDEHEAKIDKMAAWLGIDPEIIEDAPVVSLVKLIGHQLFAWQTYLLLNVSSGPGSLQRPKERQWWRLSHFDPFSSVFRPQEALYVFITDVGLALVFLGLYAAAQRLPGGWGTVGLLYGVPYFWVHHWLIAITYLHHNHPEVHHYDENGWTFVKGALATVDRDFGWVDRHLFHGIIGTHVVHHLFARIPFYYAEEATEAIKPMLGNLYTKDERSFYGQLWSVFRSCKYVEKDPKVPGAMRWHKET